MLFPSGSAGPIPTCWHARHGFGQTWYDAQQQALPNTDSGRCWAGDLVVSSKKKTFAAAPSERPLQNGQNLLLVFILIVFMPMLIVPNLG
eukprot:5893711-Pyramimonas_sp.AAC.1